MKPTWLTSLLCDFDGRITSLDASRVAATRQAENYQWRQREFKVGGDEPREPTVRLPD